MMKMLQSFVVFVLMFALLSLTGCGGGGGSSSGQPQVSAQTVTGVAATGAPLVGTVYLKDSSNPARELSSVIKADGSFSFDVTGLTAPYMLKAVGTANGQNYTLFSFAGAPGIANVNPLSHLAVVRGNRGVDPAALYTGLTSAQAQAIAAAVAAAIPQIQSQMHDILAQYGATSTDFISAPYVANHVGLDLMFDVVAITASNGTLTVSNKVSGAQILTTALDGTTLSGQVATANIPAIPAQTVGAVFIYPPSASVPAGGTANFGAIVVGSSNQAVTWSVVEANGGSITTAGKYTAPAIAGTYHVKATSAADTGKSSTAAVLVTSSGSTPGSGTVVNAFSENLIAGHTFTYTATYDGNPNPTTGTMTFNSDHTFSCSSPSFATWGGQWSIDNIGRVITIAKTGRTAALGEVDVFVITSGTTTTFKANDVWTMPDGETGVNYITFTR